MDREDNFEKKKATKIFHGMRACFSSRCMHGHVCGVYRCVFVCHGKKEKTAYLEYIGKSFGIVKSNTSKVLIKTVTRIKFHHDY